jgi:hypothetical protein
VIDTRIARVAKKLKHVQETWQDLPESFGAEVHEFRMNPPLSEQDLLAFEAEHGILLPEDYRAFLQCIGNGVPPRLGVIMPRPPRERLSAGGPAAWGAGAPPKARAAPDSAAAPPWSRDDR